MAYRSDNRGDRWKAIAAVIAVHLVLGAVILTGLNVKTIKRAVDRLQTFDITLDQAPPQEPPPPLQENRAKKPEGQSGRKPSEIVAPEPRIEVPTVQPVAAAPEAGTGTASSTGSGTSGSGPGAGSGGSGAGGGGTGAGNIPARLVRNLSRSDYRSLTGGRIAQGSAALAIRVDPAGRVDSCKVIRSSGDSQVDSGICGLVARRLRFEPARDSAGRPIPYFTNYLATWRR